MQRYIAARLIQLIPVLFFITLVPFSLLLLLPGDPATAILGGDQGVEVDPLLVRQLREDLALDDPIPVQYARWLSRAVRGDFGEELASGKPAFSLVISRVPVSLELGLIAIAISLVVGIPLGTIAAVYRGTVIDMAATMLALVGVAMPSFWLALLLILFFGVELGWFQIIGYVPLVDDPLKNLKGMVLPAIALSGGGAAIIARMSRSAMLEVLAQDYVRTARAKGLTERAVVVGHAFRNALLPVLTVVGLQAGQVFAGAVIIESIFSLPGVGRLLIDAIRHREFFVVQCSLVMIAIGVVLTNLAVDIAYRLADPRIKYG
ncbi:MAG: ABC transporter permease [Chloroflexota bacterium]